MSGGGPRTDPVWPARRPPSNHDGPRGRPVPDVLSLLVMTAVIALVVAHWGLWTDSALNRGMFNFDSLWYHMPFAADMAQSHSVTGFHHTETVFANWFYPQNSELLHAVGILVVERDTLSLFVNYGWLAIALLAAWCIGRPFGRGHLSVVAIAILLESHILIVREPAAAKNDLAVAALMLAAIAILITAWTQRETASGREGGPPGAAGRLAARRRRPRGRPRRRHQGHRARPGRGAERRGDRPGAAAPPPRRRGVVVRPRPARRRLLVPAQPGRGRQPDPRDRPPRPAHAAPPRAPADGQARLRHRPLRDRHRGLERLLLPRPPQRLRRALAVGSRWRRWPERSSRSAGDATGPCAGSAEPSSSAWSPTCSRPSAPPAPRAGRPASSSTSATCCRPCSPASPCCRCRVFSTSGGASGPCSGPCSCCSSSPTAPTPSSGIPPASSASAWRSSWCWCPRRCWR